MELRNADGGTAEMSGNGIRCLAQAAVDAGLVSPAPLHGGHRRRASARSTSWPGRSPGWARASVDMGPVTLGPDQPQDFEDRKARTVDVGNPHLVLLGPDVAGVDIADARAPAAVRLRRAGSTWSGSPGRRRRRASCSTCGSGSAGPARPWPVAPGAWPPPRPRASWGVVSPDGPVRVRNPGGMLEVTLGDRPGDPASWPVRCARWPTSTSTRACSLDATCCPGP